jgi:hypothetical protein
MSSVRAIALLSMCVLACVRAGSPSAPEAAPVTNDDVTCLPSAPTSAPAVARARADLMKRLIMATPHTDPEMPAYLQRLAEHHFTGGHVAGGCKVVQVAMTLGDTDDVAKTKQLRLDHCFDGRAQRCTTWYEPAPTLRATTPLAR